MITLNSDDPAMFATTLAREYQIAQQTFAFTDEHLRELARNSFEASFLPAEKKTGIPKPLRRRRCQMTVCLKSCRDSRPGSFEIMWRQPPSCPVP